MGKREEEEKLGASGSKKKCEWKIERKKGVYSILKRVTRSQILHLPSTTFFEIGINLHNNYHEVLYGLIISIHQPMYSYLYLLIALLLYWCV